MEFSRLKFICCAMLLSLVLGAPGASHAATIIVTSLDDDGTGTLRNAVATAAPGDTVTFSVVGTIALTTGELEIDKVLTINGPGADLLAVSGSNSSRVFHITSQGDLVLSGVTVRDGQASEGAGIHNDGGNAELDGVVITENNDASGGSFGGGGLANRDRATTTITRSTISNNESQSPGGGIFNDSLATLTITDSTVSRNNAAESGGIYNKGDMTAQNVTVSGNLGDPSGLGNERGDMMLTHSTIAANFGVGLKNNGGTVQLAASIVANNLFGPDCEGTIDSLGNNLDTDGDCDLTEPSDLSTDPMLASLAENGGPTETHALNPASAALGHIALVECLLTADQRGFVRPQGTGCDIGAYEGGTVCVLEQTATFNEGRLALDYVLGVAEPASLSVWLFVGNGGSQIGPLELPALEPPIEFAFPAAFPVASTGTIGVLSYLSRGADLICTDFDVVDTRP